MTFGANMDTKHTLLAVDKYFGIQDQFIPPEHQLRWVSDKPIIPYVDLSQLKRSQDALDDLFARLDGKLHAAWLAYAASLPRQQRSFIHPKWTRNIDKLRWWLHIKLLEWKIIV